jgi:hypothetical protein
MNKVLKSATHADAAFALAALMEIPDQYVARVSVLRVRCCVVVHRSRAHRRYTAIRKLGLLDHENI